MQGVNQLLCINNEIVRLMVSLLLYKLLTLAANMASQVWVVDICNFIIEQGMLYNMRHQSVQESWAVPGKTKPTLPSQLSNCLLNYTHLTGLTCLDKGIVLIRGKLGDVNLV